MPDEGGGKYSPFREDFFQRVTNVNWPHELECYFMAADGGDLVNGGSAYGAGNIWASDDGREWEQVVHNLNRSGGAIGSLTQGIWIRQKFNMKGKPCWVFGGQGINAAANKILPVIIYSLDGKSIHQVNVQSTQFPTTGAPGAVYQIQPKPQPTLSARSLQATLLYGFLEDNNHSSRDGVNWTGGKADVPPPKPPVPGFPDGAPDEGGDGGDGGGDGGDGGGGDGGGDGGVPTQRLTVPEFELQATQPRQISSPVAPFSIAQPINPTIIVPQATQISKPAIISPLAATSHPKPKTPKTTNDIFRWSATSAFGRVKHGQYAGRTLRVVGQFVDIHHFSSTLFISDAKTGEYLGTTDSGVPTGHGINYGYYVFVVAGNFLSGDLVGCVSWSEDGFSWNVVRLSNYPMWPIVVGPRN